ncbi:MAG TPA: hypothetical protein VH186_09855 [Chloroflexia bacterium]|nr:hypothetical protein [Chloroflexia bacterium]
MALAKGQGLGRGAGNGKELFQAFGRVFGAVLAVLLSLQIAPGTMNTVVIIGVAGFFVVLVILIIAWAMVLSSRNQAEALVRISEQALESQVRTVPIRRAGRSQLDRFLEAGGLVLEKEESYYLAGPGYKKPLPVTESGLTEEEVDYLIENQQSQQQ